MRAIWGPLVVLACACEGTDPIEGTGGGPPGPSVLEFSEPASAGALRPLMMVDLNGDGPAEIVTADDMGAMLAIHAGNPERDPTMTTSWADLPASKVVFAKVNGDDVTDLVAASYNGKKVSVLEGLGGGAFAATPVALPTSVKPNQLVVASFDANPAVDLIIQGEFSGSVVELYSGNGDGTFATPASPIQAIQNATHLFTDDLNADTRPDLLIGSPLRVFVMLANGDGTFQEGWSLATEIVIDALNYVDVDSDGKRDLLYSASSVLHFARNLGDGTFAEPVGDTKTTVRDTQTCDLDGDSKLDLVASYTDSIRWYLGRGDGTFHEASTLPFNLPTGVLCGDFDGDQRNDLVVFNKYRTGIEVFFRL